MLGYDQIGTGQTTIIVTNDWICDTSTWENARAYLDTDRFTWVFADLRGYGRSMECSGEYTLQEAAEDVLKLADRLQQHRFVLVGHSMSTLIALHLAQHHADRIGRVVVLTPAPPAGFPYDDARRQAMRALALGDDAKRLEWLRMRLGTHTSEGWARFKTARWRTSSNPSAVAAYSEMFPKGLPSPTRRISMPVLAVTGERDIDVMRRDAVMNQLSPICQQLTVISLSDSGHYPMQETPPALVAVIERFAASVEGRV